MPSDRSKPSEMTGEKAARSNVRSISLATCWRPFWITTRVTGSIASMVPDYPRAPGSRRRRCADRDLEVAEGVDPDAIRGLDHRGGVELLHDRRARQGGPGQQVLAPVDGRVM